MRFIALLFVFASSEEKRMLAYSFDEHRESRGMTKEVPRIHFRKGLENDMDDRNTVNWEREINLYDFAAELLAHWKRIVAFMLLGGLLFGTGGYFAALRTMEAEAEMSDQQMEMRNATEGYAGGDLQTEQSGELMTDADILRLYEQAYEDAVAYYNQSVLMQVDPLQVPMANLTLCIISEQENADSLISIYRDIARSAGMYEYLGEMCGVSTGINELLEVTVYAREEPADKREAVMGITVVHSEEETCKAMAEAVLSYIGDMQEKLQDTLGIHDVIVVNESFARVVSANILAQQKTNMVNIQNLKTSIEGIEKNIPKEAVLPQSEGVKATVSVKHILLGMVLFALLYVGLAFCRLIFNNKLRVTDNLQKVFHIPQIAVTDNGIRYWNRKRIPVEESINLAASAINMQIQKQGLKTIGLVGCELAQDTFYVCDTIQNAVESNDVSVKILNNVLYSAESLEELGDVQGVVLVEKAGKTKYEEIAREIELFRRYDIMLLGGIVVG